MSTILTDDEIDAAWEGPTPSGYGKSRYDIARAVIAAYEAKLAQQKPVAWRYQDAKGNFRYRGYKVGFDTEYPILKPVALYTHPAPQQADRQQIYDAATHASAMAVFMTRMDAEQPDADDKGVSGWLQDAEDRIRSRASQPLEKLISQADRQRVPECHVARIGHRFVGDRQEHIPTLLIEFDPVPVGAPCDAKGWKDRDALAAMLAAAPEAPAQGVPDAMKAVIAAMQSDPGYAWSWHCNVAMAFVDAGGDHYTANQGAARFMRLLANVEPAHELPADRQRVPEGWKLVPSRCPLCDYQHGHKIGCENNPLDVYLRQKAAAPEAPAQASAVDERAVHRAAFDDMRSAVRFAPSSAYWSAKLREFFGPDARSGIDALEKQLREARAALAQKGGE